MPQIKSSLAVFALAATLALTGCGDTNPKALSTPHPAAAVWTAEHQTAGKTNLDSCFECHGEELDGGIAKVSCTSCHLGSPEKVHPVQWGSYAYARHGKYVTDNGTFSCTTCHGASLEGAGTAPNCATKCHIGGAAKFHPGNWTNGLPHKDYMNGLSVRNDKTSCKNAACHGANLKGVFLSGPTCYSCHAAALLETAP